MAYAVVLVLFAYESAFAAVLYLGNEGSNLFSDGLVLQRGKLRIWGKAGAGESIRVQRCTPTCSELASALSSAAGDWLAESDPQSESGRFELRAQAFTNGTFSTPIGNAISVENVVIGDVWLLSGQSNMVHGSLRSLIKPYPLATPTEQPGLLEKIDPPVRWYKANVGWGEAPAPMPYWFGVVLGNRLNHSSSPPATPIPLGIVIQAVGGSGIATWLARSDGTPTGTTPTPTPLYLGDPDYKKLLPDTLIKKKDGRRYERYVGRLKPMALKGVVWWQGEKNKRKPAQYLRYLPALIRTWRLDWEGALARLMGSPVPNFRMPFIFVQLLSGGGIGVNDLLIPTPDPRDLDDIAAKLRNVYLDTLLRFPDTEMVVTTDLEYTGSHPHVDDDPYRVYANRAVEIALAKIYSTPVPTVSPALSGNCSGPVFNHATTDCTIGSPNCLRLHFRPNTANGLKACAPPTPCPNPTPSQQNFPLVGFEFSGNGIDFVWASAEIDNSTNDETVVVWSATPVPTAMRVVRYGWEDKQGPPRTKQGWANLFNRNDLAAAPFSTDLQSSPTPTRTPTTTPTPTRTPTT